MTRDVVITCPFSSILYPCETTVTMEGDRIIKTVCSSGAELRPDYPGWDVVEARARKART